MSMIRCAAAKANITPPADLLPDLYGLMRKRYAGIIDELFVRLLLIENDTDRALFVGWDVDKAPIPETILPKLSEATGVALDHILYFAVHTHTAPLHSSRENDGPNKKAAQDARTVEATEKYEKLLGEAVLGAAAKAMADLKPARIGWETGSSYIGENRVQDYFIEKEDGSVQKVAAIGSNPYTEISHELFVMRIESTEGEPIAFLINYPVHCCVMIGNDFDGKGGMGISADLAGEINTTLESRFPGCVSLWSSGAAGDINPIMMNQINYADPVTGEPKEYREYKPVEMARIMKLSLASRQIADILQVNRKLECTASDADISGGSVMVCTPGQKDEDYKVRLQAVRIGDVIFCGASGELYGSLGKAIRDQSSEKVVTINHESSLLVESGYIIDDETFARCKREDGRVTGVPGIDHTNQKPGYIKDALMKGAAQLFEKL